VAFLRCGLTHREEKLMADKPFHAGEQLWLRGKRVAFVDYHAYAGRYRESAAVVRRPDETEGRVVSLRKLARDRLDSLARETTLILR
jgi:hypothetical protein